jgi:DNA-binding transcriptional LysR family regulator
MSLRAVNLNLIPVLQALLREQSVSRAAQAVGMSQPAVSNALARLREALDDALLVQTGRTMALTPRARQLIAPVDEICEGLEALWRTPGFNAATLQRKFVISTTDYGPILIAPRLRSVLATDAPGVSMQFVDVPIALTSGASAFPIDFMISPRFVFERLDATQVRFMPLFHDEMAVVVSADHRLARLVRPAPADFASEKQVVFDYPLGGASARDMAPTMFGAPIGGETIISVQHFSLLPLMAVLTGAVVIAPRRLAELMGAFLPLHIIEEAEPRARVEMCLGWSTRLDGDPAHIWFRTLLQATMGDARFASG